MEDAGKEEPIGNIDTSLLRTSRTRSSDDPEYLRGAVQVLDFLHNVWQEQMLCDIVVTSKGGNVQTHRVVLGTHGDALTRALYRYSSDDLLRLDLSEFKTEAVVAILRFLYTTELELNCHIIGQVVTCASELGLDSVTQLCVDYLSNLNVNNAVLHYSVAENNALWAVRDRAFAFIVDRFAAVSKRRHFLHLPHDRLARIVAVDAVCAGAGELVVLSAVLRWIDFAPDERQGHAGELLRCLSFETISPERLVKEMESVSWVDKNPECMRDLLYSAMKQYATQESNYGEKSPSQGPGDRQSFLRKSTADQRQTASEANDVSSHTSGERRYSGSNGDDPNYRTSNEENTPPSSHSSSFSSSSASSRTMSFDTPAPQDRASYPATTIQSTATSSASSVPYSQRPYRSSVAPPGGRVTTTTAAAAAQNEQRYSRTTQPSHAPPWQAPPPAPFPVAHVGGQPGSRPSQPGGPATLPARTSMLPPPPPQGVPGPPPAGAQGQPPDDGAQTRQSSNQAPSSRTSSQGQTPFAVGRNPPLWPSKSLLKRSKLRRYPQTGLLHAPPVQQQYQRRSVFLSDPDRQRRLAPGGGGPMSVIPNLVAVGGIDLESDDPDSPGRFLYAFNLQSNKWNALDSSMRRYIHHHGVGMINGKLYVVGGAEYDSDQPENLGVATNELTIYNPVNRSWTSGAPMHFSRSYVSVVVWRNLLFAVGGEDEFKQKLDSLESYDPRTNRWTIITQMPGGAKVGAAAAVCHDCLFVVGGYNREREDGSILKDVECFDLISQRWSVLAPLTIPRCHSSLVEVGGNRLFLIGGRSTASQQAMTSLGAVDEYYFSNDTWVRVANLEHPRHDAGCAVIGSLIFVVGGMRSPSTLCMRSVECFDVTTGSWIRGIEDFPCEVTGAACCVMSGRTTTMT